MLTILTSNIRRVPLIIILMGLFVIGNILTATATNFSVLVIARIMTALLHATFFTLCLILATTLVKPEFQGRVISRITIGLNLATVLGVPLGTLISHQYGWQSTFMIIAIFQSLITIILLFTTRHVPERTVGNISSD